MAHFSPFASNGTEGSTADGFITPPAGTWRLKDSPVEFLRNYITNVRRDCESIDKTHIGKVLDGTLLEERDFVWVRPHDEMMSELPGQNC